MGAGASTGSEYATAEEAIAAGKTQAEVDAWIAANPAKDAAAEVVDIEKTPETDAAAAKLQAIQRGKQAKAVVVEKKQANAENGAATQMQKIQRGRLDKARVGAIKKLFESCDSNKDNNVAKKELLAGLNKLSEEDRDTLDIALGIPNPKETTQKEGLTTKEKRAEIWKFREALEAFFGAADEDGDGKISFQEFSDFVEQHKKTEKNLAKLDAAAGTAATTTAAGDIAGATPVKAPERKNSQAGDLEDGK